MMKLRQLYLQQLLLTEDIRKFTGRHLLIQRTWRMVAQVMETTIDINEGPIFL
jgi:hypothetical protein